MIILNQINKIKPIGSHEIHGTSMQLLQIDEIISLGYFIVKIWLFWMENEEFIVVVFGGPLLVDEVVLDVFVGEVLFYFI